MINYKEILCDLDFLMYHQCIIYDIPLDQMLYTGFCYDDMIRDFWDRNYSEEQLTSLINEFNVWFESIHNTKEEILDENMISLTEINEIYELNDLE